MKPTQMLFSLCLLVGVPVLAQPNPAALPQAASPAGLQTAQFSPDGKHLITTATNTTLRVWDVRTGKLAGEPPHWGTWQLVSMKYGEGEKWSEAPPDQKRLKLITDTHFTWVAYETATGKLLSMAGGRYSLGGGVYKETIEYAGEGMNDYLGKQQSFTIRVEGDKLHQAGQLSDGTKIEEIWQRVK